MTITPQSQPTTALRRIGTAARSDPYPPKENPMKKALILALIAAPILLAMSYPGRNAHSGPLYLFSAIGWFGFMLAILTVLVLSVAMLIRRATRRTATDRA